MLCHRSAVDGWYRPGELCQDAGRVSCHGSAWYLPPEEDLDTVLLSAADDGRFDVFLMTYNFVNHEKAEPVLRACAEKGIGTTIMKSNPMITMKAINGYIDSFEKEAIQLSPEELGDVWDMVENHIELEKETIRLAEEARKNSKNFVIRYLLGYLMTDEQKHNEILQQMEDIKSGIYPYA